MPDYIFAYHGGKKPETPEEVEKVMAAWGAWIGGLGEAMINPGNPVGLSKTVSATGVEDHGGSNPLSGYSVVRAESIEAALEMAKGSPHLLAEGTIEVAEIIELDM